MKNVKNVKSYEVVYERDDDGWWAASVPSVRGCRTQGRSLAQARERIREALSLFVKDAQRADLRDKIVLPAEFRRQVDRQLRLRQAVEAEQRQLQASTQGAVRQLVKRGLSVRDVGELLGLSHQRVHQIIHAR
jgi:predicted RNase H-like HicB family nuclease